MSCRVWGNEFNFRCYQCWYKQMCLSFFAQMCKHTHAPQTKTKPSQMREDADRTHRARNRALQSHQVFEQISYNWMRYRISRKMNGDMAYKDKTRKKRNHHRSAIGMKSPMKCMQILMRVRDECSLREMHRATTTTTTMTKEKNMNY